MKKIDFLNEAIKRHLDSERKKMKRITKYEPSKDSNFPYKLVDNELGTELNAIHQLGRFEDLMQEYNINSIEELENILGSHKKQEEKIIDLSADLGMFQNENINLTKDIEKYWNIEEELGCSLEVVFKALEEGVYIEVEHLPDVIERPRLYCSDDFKCYCFELLYGEYVFKLSDYKKTWWLKGEK